jgi:hypothetical protein
LFIAARGLQFQIHQKLGHNIYDLLNKTTIPGRCGFPLATLHSDERAHNVPESNPANTLLLLCICSTNHIDLKKTQYKNLKILVEIFCVGYYWVKLNKKGKLPIPDGSDIKIRVVSPPLVEVFLLKDQTSTDVSGTILRKKHRPRYGLYRDRSIYRK